MRASGTCNGSEKPSTYITLDELEEITKLLREREDTALQHKKKYARTSNADDNGGDDQRDHNFSAAVVVAKSGFGMGLPKLGYSDRGDKDEEEGEEEGEEEEGEEEEGEEEE